MPLPKDKDPTEDIANALAYTAARTAANPKTAEVSTLIRPLVAPLDEALRRRQLAERAEFEARAARDFIDHEGDQKVKDFRRRLAGADGPGGAVLELVFPDSVQQETYPTGAAQAAARRELLRRADLALQSAALAQAGNQAELRGILELWRAAVAESLQRLDAAITLVTAQQDALRLARDAEHAAKSGAIDQARSALRRLADLVGSEKEAYSYTPPAAQREQDPPPEPPPAQA